MKICLYIAHYPSEEIKQFPLSLGYLSAYLRSKIPDVNIIMSDDQEEVLAFQPDVLGISSVSMVIDDAISVAAAAKAAFPSVKTVLGGYHVTGLPDYLPPIFDVGVLHEGEATFYDLIRYWEKNDTKNLSSIPGICYRDASGTVVKTSSRPQFPDLDILPFPDRKKIQKDNGYLMTSRGCPFNCSYCASSKFWDGIRFHSPARVIAEIQELVTIHDVHKINIEDDLFIADRTRLRQIVEQLETTGITKKVEFHLFVRANLVNPSVIKDLKRLNCTSIRFGAETASESLLRRLKGSSVTVADGQRLIDMCIAEGITIGGSYMFGAPGETREDIRTTIEFVRRNMLKGYQVMGFYLMMPVPGTPVWDEMCSKGLVSPTMDFSRLSLAFLKHEFDWDNMLYCNSENVAPEEFHALIDEFKNMANLKPHAVKSGYKPHGK